MRLEVIRRGQHASTNELLLEDVHKVKKILRMAVADVVQRIRRHGETVLPLLAFGCSLHHTDHPLHDIVHIREVAFAVAVVEDPDLFTLDELVCKTEIRHIRATCGAIHREEAQTRRGYVIEFGIGVRQKLVALLGGGVQRNGMIDGIIRRVWHLLVGAVDGRARGIDEVLDSLCAIVIRVTAGFKDVIKTDEVAFDVHVWMGDGIPHPGLRCQIDDDIGMISMKNILDHLLVRDVSAEKDPPGIRRLRESIQLPQAIFLQGDVVIIVDAIDTDDRFRVIVFKELFDEVRSDKPRRPGDQNASVRKF